MAFLRLPVLGLLDCLLSSLAGPSQLSLVFQVSLSLPVGVSLAHGLLFLLYWELGHQAGGCHMGLTDRSTSGVGVCHLVHLVRHKFVWCLCSILPRRFLFDVQVG